MSFLDSISRKIKDFRWKRKREKRTPEEKRRIKEERFWRKLKEKKEKRLPPKKVVEWEREEHSNPAFAPDEELHRNRGDYSGITKTPLRNAFAGIRRPNGSSAPRGFEIPIPRRPGEVTLGIDPRNKRPEGISADSRKHTMCVGKSGMGKTTWILSQMLQDAERGDSIVLIDPHGGVEGLAWKFLSYLPEERWDDVYYINPITSIEGKVIQLNFLERMHGVSKDLTKRLFMDALEKNFPRFWGPRLANILDHSLGLLYNVVEKPTLRQLSMVVPNRGGYRNELVKECTDEEVKGFWTYDFARFPDESEASVLNKIYQIMTSEAMRPFADAVESSIDLYEALNEGKIIICDLPSGKITEGIAGFIGSLMLARIYQAGMMREHIPESERKPVHVYVDEAHRFITQIIEDNMRTLRKFGILITAASQNLHEYDVKMQNELPELADTIIAFRSGEQTAKMIQGDFTTRLSGSKYGGPYESIMKLPDYNFYCATPIGGTMEVFLLKTIPLGVGPYDPEKIIEHSIEKWGDPLEYGDYTEEIRVPTPSGIEPVEYAILTRVAEMGEDITTSVIKYVNEKYRFGKGRVIRALKGLTRNLLVEHRESIKGRGRATKHLYVSLADGEPKGERKNVSDKALDLLYPRIEGPRAGGADHVAMICLAMEHYREDGFLPVPSDIAKSSKYSLNYKNVDMADWDLFPDLIIYPMFSTKTHKREEFNPDMWDNSKSKAFIVEAESHVTSDVLWDKVEGKKVAFGGHPENAVRHYKNNRDKFRLPTVFVVKSEKDGEKLEEALEEEGAEIVGDVTKDHRPECVQIMVMDVKSELSDLPQEEYPYKYLWNQIERSRKHARVSGRSDIADPDYYDGEGHPLEELADGNRYVKYDPDKPGRKKPPAEEKTEKPERREPPRKAGEAEPPETWKPLDEGEEKSEEAEEKEPGEPSRPTKEEKEKKAEGGARKGWIAKFDETVEEFRDLWRGGAPPDELAEPLSELEDQKCKFTRTTIRGEEHLQVAKRPEGEKRRRRTLPKLNDRLMKALELAGIRV